MSESTTATPDSAAPPAPSAPFRGPLAEAGTADVDWAAVLAPPDSALPLAAAVDRTVWDPASGVVDATTVADVVSRACADLGTPWPQPLASAAARVHRDGDRVVWETPAFARQDRLTRAAVAAATTLDDAWIDEVADGMWLLCEQSSWCWPAHDDTRERHGAVLATVDDPYLDLGAGEAVARLAWIDQLLGEPLDERYPGLRQRVRREARLRVFEPFLRRRDWHWIGLDGDAHNWNPWIHGNVIVAALRLLDGSGEQALRAQIIALAVEGLDRYVAVLPADGAVDEGADYWWNGACRAIEALDVLAHATGGAVDLVSAVPALRETTAFPHRMSLGGGWVVNVADGRARSGETKPWHALYRAAIRVGDDRARAYAAAHRVAGEPVGHEGDGTGRLLRAMTDAAWLREQPASAASSTWLERDVWLPSVEVLVTRAVPGSATGLTLAVKGGHNGEHHNHNDVGSFIVALDGVPVLVDPGRPTYTKQTFGPGRYDQWTMQSAWHSVPEVAGVGQGVGAEFAGRDVRVAVGAGVAAGAADAPGAASAAGAAIGSDAAASALELDLAGAYDVPELRRWTRAATLRRAGDVTGSTVEIADDWDLEGDAPVVVHVMVAGTVRLHGDEATITPVEGSQTLVLHWPAGVTAIAEVRELEDPMLSEVWGPSLTRLAFDVTGRRSFTLTATVGAD